MAHRPAQHPPEWRKFLEICEMQFKRFNINKPIVIEIGVFRGKQRQFWEQLFDAEYIGIDIQEKSSSRGMVDIMGRSQDPQTLTRLKEILGGRRAHVLFIDGGHTYKETKADFEMYAPLCTDIIAIHDIVHQRREVGEYWKELVRASFMEADRYGAALFITMHQFRFGKRRRSVGTGVIIQR